MRAESIRIHDVDWKREDGTSVSLSPTQEKLLLYLLATAEKEEYCSEEMRALTRKMHPPGTRLTRKKHMVEVAEGLCYARSLHLAVGGVAIPVFDIAAPADPSNPEPDCWPSWGLTKSFVAEPEAGGALAGESGKAQADAEALDDVEAERAQRAAARRAARIARL